MIRPDSTPDEDDKEAAFDPSAPAGRGSGLFGLGVTAKDSLFHILPVGYEATTSYRGGTSAAPPRIVEASQQVDLHDRDTGKAYEAGIVMLDGPAEIAELNADGMPAAAAARAANEGSEARRAAVERVNAGGTRLNALVREIAECSLDDGRIVGVVGGDHSVPFGLIEALAERHPGIGILHFDAHHDLRESFEGFEWSHASIMHNVMTRLDGVERLIQVGVRDLCEEEADRCYESQGRIVCHYDSDLARAGFEGISFAEQARDIVADLPQKVHVSFDVDGLDRRYCPNTGTPVPGGLDFNQAIHLVREVAETGREIVGFDLVEVAPGADEWDAIVGARLLYKLIGFTLLARRISGGS